MVHLTFLEEFLVLLLVPDNPGLWWMVSDDDLLQEVLTVPSATGNMEFTPFAALTCVHLLQFFNVCDHNVSFPDSPPRVMRNREACLTRLLFQTGEVSIGLSQIRVIFDHCFKRYHWSVRWHSEPPFKGCLPIRQEISNLSKIAVKFHGQTALALQMSLLSLCALLFLQSHLFLICVLTYND